MSAWHDLKHNPRLMGIYQTRTRILRLIREFFWSRGFGEAETPLAVRYPGQEPHLNPVPITIHDADNTTHKMYLHTSPELSMKKLLAAGFDKIFQITKTFRDYESFGGMHNPEFTMLEWYRAPGTYREIMADTEELFKYIGKNLSIEIMKYSHRSSGIPLRRENTEIKIFDAWERKTIKKLWRECVGVELNEFLELDKLAELARLRGYQVSATDTYDDLFFKIFLNEVEPHLGIERPVFIYDYPAQMASLSRLCAPDSRYAERFELYIGGLEIANAFGELLDADEQKRRLENDRALRQALGKETWPVDPDFIAALRSGIPSPASGIALGVDRMVVLFTGARDINEVIFDSIADQSDNR